MKYLIQLLFVATCLSNTAYAQVKELKDTWPVQGDGFYQGFDQTIDGTELDFFPFLDDGNISLYLGENGKYKSITFKTEPIPADYTKPYITYIWSAGLAKTAAGEQSSFRVFLNGSEYVTFKTHKEEAHENWEFTDSNGVQLAFVSTFADKKHGDLFGYMFLNVPVDKFEKGQPLTIKIDEVKSNDRDYYMAIQNPVKETLEILAEPAILKSDRGHKQSIKVKLTHLGHPTTASFSLDGKKIQTTDISVGENEILLLIDPVTAPLTGNLEIAVHGRDKVTREVDLKPVRHFEVYFLPHSHVDIGFTHKQQEVAELQWKNLDLAIDLAEKTADYPERSKYKWNAEISWVLDTYFEQASEEQKERFVKAVENGSIGIDALYGSVLTGIQKEEELFKNTLYTNKLIKKYGFDVRSAMITDVPGYTWGLVPGLAKTGIDYISVGPNHMPHLPHGGHQVGHTFEAWGDIPFYWVSPSGKEKILFWMSTHGYSWFHSWSVGDISKAGGGPVLNFLSELEQQAYPYDIVQLRYNIGNDNGPPDPDMPDFFKKWNEKYEYPKFRIATTMEMMTDFEDKYSDQIPEATGDFTPYWEDGAASSTEETALNRNTADRLVQAETLYAMLNDDEFPTEKMDQAWNNIVLFSEHTWGANVSKSDPDSEFTKSLWEVKKGFVLDATSATNEMIESATISIKADGPVDAIQVINTSSWKRTDLVKLPKEWQKTGDRIVDDKGDEIAAQVLSTGELAFVAQDIPAFGSKTYTLKKGEYKSKDEVSVSQNELSNGVITVMMDPERGTVKSLKYKGINNDFINSTDSTGFNRYWYSGLIKENLSHNYNPTITVKEKGPVISSVVIESEGAGANKVIQEVQVIDGLEKVNIINTVDKQRVIENENVRFSFPFSVPDGMMRIDIPWAVLEPGENQLKGANNNFYCAQRFFDISNNNYGVTVATPDVPLLEIGDMYGQFWMKDMKTRPWLKNYEPSQTIYSWAMNNAWFVNYKAYQEGLITMRYAIKPHGEYSASEAKKFGMEQTTPLLVIPVEKKVKPIDPVFSMSGSDDVIVTSLKPSEDGKAMMVRFFNSSEQAGNINIDWGSKKPSTIYVSSPLEEQGEETDNTLNLVPWEIVTIRAEM